MPDTKADEVVASAVEGGIDCGGVCRETEGAGEGVDAERAVVGRGSNDRRGRWGAAEDAATDAVPSAAETDNARLLDAV